VFMFSSANVVHVDTMVLTVTGTRRCERKHTFGLLRRDI
jgi:hypothetical protein